jgi:hypothetical protein
MLYFHLLQFTIRFGVSSTLSRHTTTQVERAFGLYCTEPKGKPYSFYYVNTWLAIVYNFNVNSSALQNREETIHWDEAN